MAANKSEFKVGDRVRCVNDVGAFPSAFLRVGDTYTVRGFFSNEILVEGCRASWRPDRFELVTPALSSAIRTVTRREIVPGFYEVCEISEPTADGVRVHFPVSRLNHSDLRAAAKLFNEIADVLDEQQKEAA